MSCDAIIAALYVDKMLKNVIIKEF